jgi:NAD(P)-dependent dehydrogenase (short-subunit alcohol dehydrogenase family)
MSLGEETRPARVAVITGAGGGIGRATAEALAARGMSLCLVERDRARLETIAAALSAGDAAPQILSLSLDVASEADMQAMAERTLQAFGRIDVLVTAAGILRPPGRGPTSIADTTADEFDTVMAVNLRGTFLATRAVLPFMLTARSGQIVHISSVAGLQGRAFDGPYCASKFAVRGFSESVAEEVSRSGVRVHTLLPDAVATPLWEQNGPVPMPPDALPPQRIANFIAYLLDMPEDCVLRNPVIAPFGGVRRKRRRREADEPRTATDVGVSPQETERS